jgi:DHA1 family tetracycline resistance protein-like MFS transporter
MSLPLLFVSRLVAGVAGANFSIVQATIADITEPKNRARNFGLIGGAVGLGFILGPLMGGYIVALTGNPALPFLFAGCLGVCNVLFITLTLSETHAVRAGTKSFSLFKAFSNIKTAYLDVDARPLYTVSFLQMLGFGVFTSFSAVFLTFRFNFTEADTGTFFAIVGICIVFAQLFVVRLAGVRYSERAIIRFALPLLAVTLCAQAFVFNVWLMYGLIPFVAVSVSLITTNLPALISKGVSDQRQGAALGINGSLQALSQGIAPLLASGMATALGIPVIFVLAGGLVLGAYFLFPKVMSD